MSECSPIPTGSTSIVSARWASISHSGTACTAAWARRWRGWRAASRWRRLLDLIPEYEVDRGGLRRVAMANVCGWSNVPVRKIGERRSASGIVQRADRALTAAERLGKRGAGRQPCCVHRVGFERPCSGAEPVLRPVSLPRSDGTSGPERDIGKMSPRKWRRGAVRPDGVVHMPLTTASGQSSRTRQSGPPAATQKSKPLSRSFERYLDDPVLRGRIEITPPAAATASAASPATAPVSTGRPSPARLARAADLESRIAEPYVHRIIIAFNYENAYHRHRQG